MKLIHEFPAGVLHRSKSIGLSIDDFGKYHLSKMSGMDFFGKPYFEEVIPDKDDGFCEVSWWSLVNVIGSLIAVSFEKGG